MNKQIIQYYISNTFIVLKIKLQEFQINTQNSIITFYIINRLYIKNRIKYLKPKNIRPNQVIKISFHFRFADNKINFDLLQNLKQFYQQSQIQSLSQINISIHTQMKGIQFTIQKLQSQIQQILIKPSLSNNQNNNAVKMTYDLFQLNFSKFCLQALNIAEVIVGYCYGLTGRTGQVHVAQMFSQLIAVIKNSKKYKPQPQQYDSQPQQWHKSNCQNDDQISQFLNSRKPLSSSSPKNISQLNWYTDHISKKQSDTKMFLQQMAKIKTLQPSKNHYHHLQCKCHSIRKIQKSCQTDIYWVGKMELGQGADKQKNNFLQILDSIPQFSQRRDKIQKLESQVLKIQQQIKKQKQKEQTKQIAQIDQIKQKQKQLSLKSSKQVATKKKQNRTNSKRNTVSKDTPSSPSSQKQKSKKLTTTFNKKQKQLQSSTSSKNLQSPTSNFVAIQSQGILSIKEQEEANCRKFNNKEVKISDIGTQLKKQMNINHEQIQKTQKIQIGINTQNFSYFHLPSQSEIYPYRYRSLANQASSQPPDSQSISHASLLPSSPFPSSVSQSIQKPRQTVRQLKPNQFYTERQQNRSSYRYKYGKGYGQEKRHDENQDKEYIIRENFGEQENLQLGENINWADKVNQAERAKENFLNLMKNKESFSKFRGYAHQGRYKSHYKQKQSCKEENESQNQANKQTKKCGNKVRPKKNQRQSQRQSINASKIKSGFSFYQQKIKMKAITNNFVSRVKVMLQPQLQAPTIIKQKQNTNKYQNTSQYQNSAKEKDQLPSIHRNRKMLICYKSEADQHGQSCSQTFLAKNNQFQTQLQSLDLSSPSLSPQCFHQTDNKIMERLHEIHSNQIKNPVRKKGVNQDEEINFYIALMQKLHRKFCGAQCKHLQRFYKLLKKMGYANGGKRIVMNLATRKIGWS